MCRLGVEKGIRDSQWNQSNDDGRREGEREGERERERERESIIECLYELMHDLSIDGKIVDQKIIKQNKKIVVSNTKIWFT